MWYQNRLQLQTVQFPLTQRVNSQWPRFNQLRDGQKLPKNRLWRICINTNCENKNDWLDYWSGRKKNQNFLKHLKLPARLLVRPGPDQPDRLLRPCPITPTRMSEKAAYAVKQLLTLFQFYLSTTFQNGPKFQRNSDKEQHVAPIHSSVFAILHGIMAEHKSCKKWACHKVNALWWNTNMQSSAII